MTQEQLVPYTKIASFLGNEIAKDDAIVVKPLSYVQETINGISYIKPFSFVVVKNDAV